MDNDQTNTTETGPEQPDIGEGNGIPFGMLMAAARGLNSAEGVGPLLNQTAAFVGAHLKAEPGFISSPEGDLIPVFLKPGGSVEFVPQEKFDEFGDNPRWRRGKATMTSLSSFIAHINRFGDEDSAVFANDSRSSPSLTAVLDYHRADTLVAEGEDGERAHGEYRHGLHRTHFAFPLSDQWQAWHARNGQRMTMADFAVFLEDNVLDVADVVEPPESAARFVEMNGGKGKIADWSMLNKLAKSLTIYENAVVTEAVNLSSGEGVLTLAAEHDTEVAGIKATVPTMFFIAIPIFREGVIYRLPVRLRYRKERGGVTFWYELWRADRAFDDAFHEAVERVGSETEATIFFGSPEA